MVAAYKNHYDQVEAELRSVVEAERRRLHRWQRTARMAAVFCFLAGSANIFYLWFARLFHILGG